MRLRPGVPVLAMPSGAVRVGIARPVVLRDLPPDAAAFVASLEGRAARITPAEAADHAAIIEILERQGLADAAREPESRALGRCAVRVRGVTPVTQAAALALADAGVGAIGATSVRRASGGAPAANLHRLLSERAPGIGVAAPYAPVELEIVAGHGAIDPVAARDLTGRDLPHLPVVTDDAGVTIGPIVVPGRTPCLRCIDLHRCDEDPAWAVAAFQLAAGDRRAALTPDAAALAGAIAAREAARFLLGPWEPGPSWRVNDARHEPPRPGLLATAHAACGCGAM